MTNKELLKKLEIIEKEIEKIKIEKQQIINQRRNKNELFTNFHRKRRTGF